MVEKLILKVIASAASADAPINEFGFICGHAHLAPPVEFVSVLLALGAPLLFFIAWLVARQGNSSAQAEWDGEE